MPGPSHASGRKVAHLGTAGDCCTAGVQSDFMSLWVIHVMSVAQGIYPNVRCSPLATENPRRCTTSKCANRDRVRRGSNLGDTPTLCAPLPPYRTIAADVTYLATDIQVVRELPAR
jgi:hypothetical protein